jgi:putative peptidoglycan lipid II flippase
VSFLAQIIIAAKFGSSEERDAYFLALAIISYPILVHQNSLVATFLPNYAQALVDKSDKEFKNLVFYDFIFLTLLSLVVYFGAEFHLFSGFTKQEKVYSLLKILCWAILFQGISHILSAIKQAENSFTLPALQNIIITICSLVSVFIFGNQLGIDSLAWGFLGGNFLHCLFLLFSGVLKGKNLISLPIHYKLDKRNIQHLLQQSYWLAGVALLNKMIQPLERMLATQLNIGTTSYLGYAFQIIAILVNVFATSIIVTSFASLSQSWAKKEIIKFTTNAKDSLKIVFLIAIPMIGWLVIYADNLVRIFLERGNFTKEDTFFVSETLKILSVFLLTTSLNAILNKLFYITQRGKILLLISTISFTFYVCFAALTYKSYLYKGLAWAFVLESLLYTLMGHYIVFKLFKINILYAYVKILLITIFPLISLYTFKEDVENVWILTLKSLCYFISYGILAHYFISFKPFKSYET